MTDSELSGAARPSVSASAFRDTTRMTSTCVDLDFRSGPAGALAMLVDASELFYAIKDLESWRYVHVSPRMAEFLGATAEQVVGLTDGDLLDPSRAAVLRAADLSAATHPAVQRSEHLFDMDGQPRHYTVWRLAWPAGDERGSVMVSLWRDESATQSQALQLRAALLQVEEAQRMQVELRQQLRDQALRDEATGLYRQGHFLDQLRREIDLSSREHREFSLVSIALDPQDDQASAAGTAGRLRVLESLGQLLQHNTRAMDASCRVDEELFAVLLSGVGLSTAHARMEGMRRQCAMQVVVQDGQEIRYTVSMGIASFPHTSADQDELIVAADKALMQALHRGNYVSLASITLESPPAA